MIVTVKYQIHDYMRNPKKMINRKSAIRNVTHYETDKDGWLTIWGRKGIIKAFPKNWNPVVVVKAAQER